MAPKSSFASEVKKCGAWLLEDACQALLSDEVGRFSDFVLYSPRKFLGVPDGGVLVSNCEIDFYDVILDFLYIKIRYSNHFIILNLSFLFIYKRNLIYY